MKIKSLILTVVIGLAVASVSMPKLEAQASIPPLPADLLFTTSSVTGGGDYPRDIIARVNAGTLEITPFYVDGEALEVMPVSWSPQGDLLAIYRRMPAIDEANTLFPRQLCVLDRTGVLQRCFDDIPPMHYAGRPIDWTYYYPVVWGVDGQTIYFDTEYLNENSPLGYGKRLVEASVITGETLRVVYAYPDPFPVMSSPDLTHVAVGFGGPWYGGSNPAYVLNLATGVQLNVPNLMPDNSGLSWTCWPFSPLGSYFTVRAEYNLANYAPELEPPDDYREGRGHLLLLLDTQGSIQHVIGEPEGSPAALWNQECPGWQPDEQAIVFLAYDAQSRYIMRYSLSDRQSISLYEAGFDPGREPYIHSLMIPSPGGTHVALTVSDGPYEDRLVAVLYPDGEIYRIPSSYRFSLYPLWVPPLETPNFPPNADAGPDQTVSTTGDTTLVTLDGSGSTDSDGTIVSYQWHENGELIAEGINPQVLLGIGAHSIILTVEDDDGATDEDEVIITVETATGCVPSAPADPPTYTVAAGDVPGLIAALTAANANPSVISDIAWKPDGSRLAVGYRDGTLEIREAANETLEDNLVAHTDSITALAWHPTADWLLSGSEGEIFLWDLSTDISFDLRDSYSALTTIVRGVSWSADGSRIFASEETDF